MALTLAETTIPLFATRGAITPLLDQVAERQRAVLDSGCYILGPEGEGFESEFAAHIGRRHCIGVANGTEAITIALRALGVGAGDEVIVPGISFFATAEAVVNAGSVPVFADIDPETHCMTAATIEPLITSRTRALVPVHLFGNPAPMEEISALAAAHDLKVLEDAAQAAGARLGERRAGALGDAATFSFYPGKNLGATGDAGAVLTDDDEVAERARVLREHGRGDARWRHAEVGYNSRLDELQAAALRVLLPHLDDWIVARRSAARTYQDAGIAEVVSPQKETGGGASAFHLYVVTTGRRDELQARLAEAGVESRAYYTTPLNLQPALAAFDTGRELPASQALARDGLALPMGQCLEADDVERVVEVVRAAVAASDDQSVGS